MSEQIKLDATHIAELMPQQPPFLFIDEAVISPNHAEGKYLIKPDEFFLKGHFKDNPVMPASIMMEALGQLAVLYLLSAPDSAMPVKADKDKIFFTASDGVRCSRICKPQEVLEMSVDIDRLRAPLCIASGRISVGGQKTLVVEKISLTFGFKK